MTTRTAPGRGGRAAAAGPVPGHLFGGGFSLFADMLLVGLLTALASLPVLTAPAAFGAAAAVLRRAALDGGPVELRAFGRELRTHLTPTSLAGGVVLPAVAALIAVDLALVGAGLPGAGAVAPAVALVALGTLVVAVRAAALGPAGGGVAVRSLYASLVDVRGSVLLAAAVLVAAVLAWSVPLLIPLLPGPLAFAAAAVRMRADR